jgi:hypothetical protein
MSTSNEPAKYPPFRNFLWASLLLALLGWGGLAVLVVLTLPTLGPRWLFYFLLVSALSGTALPVTYFLNLRFLSEPPADGTVISRQAIWIGIYGSLLAWLMRGRVLTLALCVVLALGFMLVEALIRVRELSLWTPREEIPADEQ